MINIFHRSRPTCCTRSVLFWYDLWYARHHVPSTYEKSYHFYLHCWIAFRFVYSFSLHDKMAFLRNYSTAQCVSGLRNSLLGLGNWSTHTNTHMHKLFVKFKIHKCCAICCAFPLLFLFWMFSFYCPLLVRRCKCKCEQVNSTPIVQLKMYILRIHREFI